MVDERDLCKCYKLFALINHIKQLINFIQQFVSVKSRLFAQFWTLAFMILCICSMFVVTMKRKLTNIHA